MSDDGLNRLRYYAERMAFYRDARDEEVFRLRQETTGEGRPRYTWDRLADAAHLSRIGVMNVFKRVAARVAGRSDAERAA